MSCRDETETRKQEDIPFSSQIVPRGRLVGEGLYTASTTLRIYVATRLTRLWWSSRDSNLGTHAWEPGTATTRPQRRSPHSIAVAVVVCAQSVLWWVSLVEGGLWYCRFVNLYWGCEEGMVAVDQSSLVYLYVKLPWVENVWWVIIWVFIKLLYIVLTTAAMNEATFLIQNNIEGGRIIHQINAHSVYILHQNRSKNSPFSRFCIPYLP